MADPGSGFFRFNQAMPAGNPSLLVIDDIAYNPAVDLGTILDVAHKFTWIKFTKKTDPTGTFAYYFMDANMTPRSGYAENPGVMVYAQGTWNNNDEFLVFYETAGSSGTSGGTGAAGTSGSSGTSGNSGTSGTSGGTGTSGTSGTSGVATINNNTDNNVLTATGGSSINGEPNLTFDGTTLYVNGALGVGTSTPTTTGLIRATNDVVAFYSSDERLKANKTLITESLDKVNQLGGYEFDWIPVKGIHENEGHDIGVIAQEVEKIFPEIVTTRDNGYKAVKYEKLTAVLIEAVKELTNKVKSLEDEINKLKNK